MRKLYLAYGANTNFNEMSYRCSDAKFLGLSEIPEHQLIFRTHCDVTPEINKSVICALWDISDRDEQNLDLFEGFPRYYIKKQTLLSDGREAFFYAMSSSNSKHVKSPDQGYLDMVIEGYTQCDIDLIQIYEALYLTNQLLGKYSR